MAGRGGYKFFLKMKKKPPLQSILDNLETMSIKDINECGQKLWIVDCLKRYKYETYGPGIEEATAEALALQMGGERQEKNSKYPVHKYTGPTKFIGNIEVNAGDMLQLADELWIGTASANVPEQDIHFVLNNSEFVDNMTAMEYRDAINQQLMDKYNLQQHESTPGKMTSGDYTHTEDLYAGEILDSTKKNSMAGSIPIIITRHE